MRGGPAIKDPRRGSERNLELKLAPCHGMPQHNPTAYRIDKVMLGGVEKHTLAQPGFMAFSKYQQIKESRVYFLEVMSEFWRGSIGGTELGVCSQCVVVWCLSCIYGKRGVIRIGWIPQGGIGTLHSSRPPAVPQAILL